MRKLLPLFVFILFINQAFCGLKSTESTMHPVSGSDILMQRWLQIDPKIRERLHQSRRPALHKATAWNFAVGQAKTWWATNMNTNDSTNNNKEYSVPATCRAVGTNCYIFVENAIWNTRVVQASADSMRMAFEQRTPANSSKGIFQLDTLYFGNPPNVDNDLKIIILILDIKDSFSGSGSYVAGYFSGINEYSETDVQAYLGSSRHSNEAEIYFVDANPVDLSTLQGIDAAASTTAHEFQHMIHFNYDPEEIAFVNEGMSESASVLCGYDLRAPSEYYANTNVNFTSWELTSDVIRDYSRAALFSWYLIEQFGSSLTRKIVNDTAKGIDGYNRALQANGSSMNFLDILKSFAVANELNNITIDSKYGFTVTLAEKPTPRFMYTSTVVSVAQDTLEPYGTTYISFTGSTNLNFLYNTNGTAEAKCISTGTDNPHVDIITKGTTYALSSFGSTYTQSTISITNLTNAKTIYTFQSSDVTGVAHNGIEPNVFSLKPCYPNPFNPSTTIEYSIPVKGFVRLFVYDVLGRIIATLVHGVVASGSHQIQWNGTTENGISAPSGVYFFRLESLPDGKGSSNFSKTERMTLLK